MDRVCRRYRVLGKLNGERGAGLRIRFVKRCPGAGDGHADAVTLVENLAHPAHVEGDLVDSPRFHQHFLIKALAIAQSPRIVHDQDRLAIRIDVADADNHIGIAGGG